MMVPQQLPWKRFSGDVAWPTVALWGACVTGFVATLVLVGQGMLSTGIGLVLNTLAAYAIFTPMHEAAHGNVRGRRAGLRGLEAVIGWTSGLLLMAPFPAFMALHLRHHSNTNDPERDPDMWVAGRGAASVAARCMTIVPHYYWEFLRGGTARSKAGGRARRSTITLVAGMALGLGIAAWLGGLGLLLTLWVVPAILASGVLAFAFDWLPHHPHVERDRHGNTRLVGGRWLTVPMLAQNYHVVHHLYPRVPFYAYGRCLRAGERDATRR